MIKIKKAVIPAAGLGTRFLPATKGVAKEMFPIIDKPTILYQVEEAISAGAEEVIIIISEAKRSIEKFFSRDEEFEKHLIETGKPEFAEIIKKIATQAKITFVIQKEQKGLGHAILCCKEAVGNEPFLILSGDDLVYNHHGKSASAQMAEAFEKTGCPIVGVQQVPWELTYKYGIVDPIKIDGRLIEMRTLIEKPKDNPPSNYAVIGRYLLTPDVFELLEHQTPGAGGEIQLTDSIKRLPKLYALELDATYYDIGSKLGFAKAQVSFALNNDEIKDEFREYLLEKLK